MNLPAIDFSNGELKIVEGGRTATLTLQERRGKVTNGQTLKVELEKKLGATLRTPIAFHVTDDGEEYVRVGDLSGPWPGQKDFA